MCPFHPAKFPINTWPRATVTFLSVRYVWLLWNAPAHQGFAESFNDPRLALDSRLLLRALVDPAEWARGDLELPLCVRSPSNENAQWRSEQTPLSECPGYELAVQIDLKLTR